MPDPEKGGEPGNAERPKLGHHAFEALSQALPEGTVLIGADVPPAAAGDWSTAEPVMPGALIRPGTTDEVATALALCDRLGLPVTAQGGRSGLAGGAVPEANGVVLSLERMTAIEQMDPVAGVAVVQAGAPLAAVQAAARDKGLIFGVDLGARDSCTIGGNLATNAGGTRVLRYGMMRENVLGLEAVLADGTVISSMNKLLKNNAGYDLKQLFIGTEGTLGVITRAVLRLQPAPATSASAFCGFRDAEAMLAVLMRARSRLGPALSAFEAMWPSFLARMTGALPDLRRPFDAPHGIHVLIEAAGAADEGIEDRLHALLSEALEAGDMTDAVIPASERDRADLWAIRESVAHFDRVFGPVIAFDIGVPVASMGDFVARVEADLAEGWPGIVAMSYGHIGDSNLHLVCHLPGAGADQPHAAVSDLVYRRVVAAGGSVSAEHGIGTLKRKALALSRSPAELALMARMKRALDPNGILNPGKVIHP